MEAIIFIGTNKSGTSREALTIAKKMGFSVILFTDRKKFLEQRDEFPEVDKIYFFQSNDEVESRIKDLIQSDIKIAAIISFIDPFVSFAAELQRRMGLVSLSVEALRTMEDKLQFRHALKHLSSAPYYLSSIEGKLDFPFPVIVKSPHSNGSKNVKLVTNKEKLKKIIKKSTEPLLIEEFLQGPQYLVEAVCYEGELKIVAIIKQDIMEINDQFIITGYQYPATLQDKEEGELIKAVLDIKDVLNMTNGNFHLEFRLVDGNWKLIEMNPRISGGAMNKIIFEGTGINFAEEIIRLNLGEKPSFIQTKFQPVYAKFLTVDKVGKLIKVTGRNRAAKYDGIKEIYVKPRKGTILRKPTSLGHRYAYVLAVGDTVEAAKEKAILAAKEIRFYIETM